jgi:hypothetical protein
VRIADMYSIAPEEVEEGIDLERQLTGMARTAA